MWNSGWKNAIRNRRGTYFRSFRRAGIKRQRKGMSRKMSLSSSKTVPNLVYDNRKRKYYNTFGEELSSAEVYLRKNPRMVKAFTSGSDFLWNNGIRKVARGVLMMKRRGQLNDKYDL